MTMTVQFDLFDALTPIATFDWANESDLKIFDYSDDIKFDDLALENNYIINVPVYRIEDVQAILDPQGNKRNGRYDFYFQLAKDKKFNHCVVRISDSGRYKGTSGDKWFVLATAKFQKYLKQKALFGMLEGNVKKMPKVYKKVVHVADIGYRKDMKRNFVQVYTLGKWSKEHVLEQVGE